MIMLDEEWNSGKDEQAANRIDRIGQTEETTVHTIRLENSIDDWMADLIEMKRQMVEGFDSNASLANDLLAAMREGKVM
jgi:SNF2 family DNA or RNA helicase